MVFGPSFQNSSHPYGALIAQVGLQSAKSEYRAAKRKLHKPDEQSKEQAKQIHKLANQLAIFGALAIASKEDPATSEFFSEIKKDLHAASSPQGRYEACTAELALRKKQLARLKAPQPKAAGPQASASRRVPEAQLENISDLMNG